MLCKQPSNYATNTDYNVFLKSEDMKTEISL